MSRICIDGFNLALPHGSGIATYARNLLAGIAADHEAQLLLSSPRPLTNNALLNEVALFDDRPQSRLGRALSALRRLTPRSHIAAHPVPLTGDVLARDLGERFPCADKIWAAHDVFHTANASFAVTRRFLRLRLGDKPGADVMHWTCALPLAEPRTANVYTLHDLIPLRLPSATLDDKRNYYDMCRTIAARADRIFTVSESSRRDIVELLGVDEARVANTYQTVVLPDRWLRRTELDVADELAGVFGLEPRGYFLFFGAHEPKKNLRRIVEAFLASRVAKPLVIAGPGWLSPAQQRRFGQTVIDKAAPPERLMRDDRIRVLEYLPADSLRTLIAGARGALFPSLYEGFGLPVLESMLLGAPVITSTTGSLPEVAGEAALLVDPYDVDAIRDAIRALDADADLRDELAARGRRQAAKFSPERYRERLRDAYAPVL